MATEARNIGKLKYVLGVLGCRGQQEGEHEGVGLEVEGRRQKCSEVETEAAEGTVCAEWQDCWAGRYYLGTVVSSPLWFCGCRYGAGAWPAQPEDRQRGQSIVAGGQAVAITSCVRRVEKLCGQQGQRLIGGKGKLHQQAKRN